MCAPHDRLRVFGYFDNSVRCFSTDERRAKTFKDVDEASRTVFDEVRVRFPPVAGQVNVTSRRDGSPPSTARRPLEGWLGPVV